MPGHSPGRFGPEMHNPLTLGVMHELPEFIGFFA